MSYDLFFFKKAENPISKNEISNYLNQIPNIKSDEAGILWEYHNKETEAYCKFELNGTEPNSEFCDSEDFPGFQNVRLSFNINYIRPKSFGKECFPIVDRLVRDLDLFILNPQGEEETPQKYDEAVLEKEWSTFNAGLVRFQKPNLSIYDRYLYGIDWN